MEDRSRRTAGRTGSSRLLIDLGPATGAHGQRGIGRYVRGLASCIEHLPNDLRERIWAAGQDGPELATFDGRAVVLRPMTTRFALPPWIAGRSSIGRAVRASAAAVVHHTDPQRPWSDARRRSLVTVYDLIPLREPTLLQGWRLDHRLAYRRYLQQIRRADRVVAISRATADDLTTRLGIAPDRIDIVYPIVEAPPGAERSDGADVTFIVLGAVDEHKQPGLALEAFAHFRRRSGIGRLRFIGPASDDQLRTLRDLADRLAIGPWVTFEGRLPDDGLEEAFATASALLLTSRVEGFGLPAVEALVRGVPVIAADTRAARETLAGAASIVAADAEAIAEGMARLAAPDPAAIEHVRSRFSRQAGARALEVAYRRILE